MLKISQPISVKYMCAWWRDNCCFSLCTGCKKWRTNVWAKYWLLPCCRGSASPASDSCWGTAFSAECSPFRLVLCHNYTLTLQKACFQGSFFFSDVIFFLFNQEGVKQDYRSMAVLKHNCMVLPSVQFEQNLEQRTLSWVAAINRKPQPRFAFQKGEKTKTR